MIVQWSSWEDVLNSTHGRERNIPFMMRVFFFVLLFSFFLFYCIVIYFFSSNPTSYLPWAQGDVQLSTSLVVGLQRAISHNVRCFNMAKNGPCLFHKARFAIAGLLLLFSWKFSCFPSIPTIEYGRQNCPTVNVRSLDSLPLNHYPTPKFFYSENLTLA